MRDGGKRMSEKGYSPKHLQARAYTMGIAADAFGNVSNALGNASKIAFSIEEKQRRERTVVEEEKRKAQEGYDAAQVKTVMDEADANGSQLLNDLKFSVDFNNFDSQADDFYNGLISSVDGNNQLSDAAKKDAKTQIDAKYGKNSQFRTTVSISKTNGLRGAQASMLNDDISAVIADKGKTYEEKAGEITGMLEARSGYIPDSMKMSFGLKGKDEYLQDARNMEAVFSLENQYDKSNGRDGDRIELDGNVDQVIADTGADPKSKDAIVGTYQAYRDKQDGYLKKDYNVTLSDLQDKAWNAYKEGNPLDPAEVEATLSQYPEWLTATTKDKVMGAIGSYYDDSKVKEYATRIEEGGRVSDEEIAGLYGEASRKTISNYQVEKNASDKAIAVLSDYKGYQESMASIDADAGLTENEKARATAIVMETAAQGGDPDAQKAYRDQDASTPLPSRSLTSLGLNDDSSTTGNKTQSKKTASVTTVPGNTAEPISTEDIAKGKSVTGSIGVGDSKTNVMTDIQLQGYNPSLSDAEYSQLITRARDRGEISLEDAETMIKNRPTPSNQYTYDSLIATITEASNGIKDSKARKAFVDSVGDLLKVKVSSNGSVLDSTKSVDALKENIRTIASENMIGSYSKAWMKIGQEAMEDYSKKGLFSAGNGVADKTVSKFMQEVSNGEYMLLLDDDLFADMSDETFFMAGSTVQPDEVRDFCVEKLCGAGRKYEDLTAFEKHKVDINQAYALCANAYGELFKDTFGKRLDGMQRVGSDFVFLVDKNHHVYARISDYGEMVGKGGKASWELFYTGSDKNGNPDFSKKSGPITVPVMLDPTLDDDKAKAEYQYNNGSLFGFGGAKKLINDEKYNAQHPDNKLETGSQWKAVEKNRNRLVEATRAQRAQQKIINDTVGMIIKFLDTKEAEDNGKQ